MTITQCRDKLDKATSKPKWTVNGVLKAFGAYYISNGIHRAVYGIEESSRFVLKIEHEGGRFDKEPNFRNITEYMTWCDFKGSCYEKWLARVYFITYDGKISIQHRAKPVTKSELPKKIPPFFCDTKVSNWGRIGTRIVCLDYAYILPDQSKMKTVKWR